MDRKDFKDQQVSKDHKDQQVSKVSMDRKDFKDHVVLDHKE
jgi:hypothetical protein